MVCSCKNIIIVTSGTTNSNTSLIVCTSINNYISLAECSPADFNLKGVISTDTNKRYYINSIYKYTCKEGYNKTELDDVICREDGNWTVTPNCTSYSK